MRTMLCTLPALAAVAAAVAPLPAPAANNDWSSPVSGKWEDAGRWSLGHAPTNTDTLRVIVGGAYTVSVDNVTADTGGADTWLTVAGLTLANSADDQATLAVGFTNEARELAINGITSIGASGALLLGDGAIVQSGNFYPAGTLNVLGGMLRITNSSARFHGNVLVGGGEVLYPSSTGPESGAFNIGYGGNCTFIQTNGSVRVGNADMGRSAVAGVDRRLTVEGGTFSAATLDVGWSTEGIHSTSTVTVAGGELVVAGAIGGPEAASSRLIVSNGTVRAASARVRRIEVHGGAALFNGAFSRFDAGTEQLLVAGGQWVCTNAAGTAVLQMGQHSRGLAATITAGRMTADKVWFFVDGSSGAHQSAAWNVHGGEAIVLATGSDAVNMDYQSRNATFLGNTSRIDVAGSGLLELRGAIARNDTDGYGSISNRNGGTIRWTGLDNPAINMGANYDFVTQDATIEFKDTGAADLAGNIATKIVYAGQNTLKLNNATNAGVAGYTFAPGQDFTHLALAGGGVFQAGDVSLDSASELTLELGAAAWGRVQATGAMSLAGTLNVTAGPDFDINARNTFDVLDWGSLSGQFDAINLPAPYSWSTSRLYTEGVISLVQGTVVMIR